VVHGPLNLINMVNLWRDVRPSGSVPKKVTYRATTPLYAGETYRVLLDEEQDNISEVKIVDSYGKVAMVGQIESV
jgi:hydroxyacyl-ACP dehydratase HTD2-like protein with hotdog domain